MEYYSAFKKKASLQLLATWINLDYITPNETLVTER